MNFGSVKLELKLELEEIAHQVNALLIQYALLGTGRSETIFGARIVIPSCTGSMWRIRCHQSGARHCRCHIFTETKDYILP